MCPTDDCEVTSCDDTCRSNYDCILSNSNAMDIVSCRGYGIWDEKYGWDFMKSLTMNPWIQPPGANRDSGFDIPPIDFNPMPR